MVVRVLSYRIHRTTTGSPLSIPVYAPGRFNVSMTEVGGGTSLALLTDPAGNQVGFITQG